METKIVIIEKWIIETKPFYWIIDTKTGEQIDGFSKKYQAVDAIKRWGLVRIDKSVKEIS